MAELAAKLGGQLLGDGSLRVKRAVHPADARTADDLAIAMQPDLAELLPSSYARTAILAAGLAPSINIVASIMVPRPSVALSIITNLFAPPIEAERGVHFSAVVHPTAQLGEGVSIGPCVVIGARAKIGAGCRLLAHVTVAEDAELGADGLFYAGVRIGARCKIGARAIIHHNASIGADGFSFTTPQKGAVESAKQDGVVEQGNTRLLRIASLGAVVMGDDVEIGANSCIDRGTLRDTIIGNGVKIDNLVQVGHNTQVGQNVMMCGQVGVAGSVVIGDRVVLGAAAGVADHVKIGADSVLGARAGVGTSHVPERSVLMGLPAQPHAKFQAEFMALRRLPRYQEKLQALELRLNALEQKNTTPAAS